MELLLHTHTGVVESLTTLGAESTAYTWTGQVNPQMKVFYEYWGENVVKVSTISQIILIYLAWQLVTRQLLYFFFFLIKSNLFFKQQLHSVVFSTNLMFLF